MLSPTAPAIWRMVSRFPRASASAPPHFRAVSAPYRSLWSSAHSTQRQARLPPGAPSCPFWSGVRLARYWAGHSVLAAGARVPASSGSGRAGAGRWCRHIVRVGACLSDVSRTRTHSKAGNDSKESREATRSEGDDLEESAARALMRHGGRGRGVRGEGRR
jgi:hypothetical protein